MLNKFNKDELLASNQFIGHEKDILSVLLEDKNYSIEECRKILKKEKERVIK